MDIIKYFSAGEPILKYSESLNYATCKWQAVDFSYTEIRMLTKASGLSHVLMVFKHNRI
jgi:hypothetical protein